MKKRIRRQGTVLLLAVCTLLGCAACGSKTAAATMHLRKAEGTVDVSDGAGKALEPRENLGLYSGYEVDTRSESFAWIDLDEVKLTKLDQDSEIEIQKDGKALEIVVNEGSLFFNVTQPLGEDETMTIRTSSMMVGIRGTCGWVEVPDSDTMKVFLLEGKVRCEADGEHETVRAGEMAVMTEDGQITVSEFTASDIPEFVVEEIEEDDDLAEAILDDSGIDVLNPVDPQDEINRRAALLEVLNSSGGASYAGLFDIDGDGREDLLLLNRVAESPYSGFRWTAYLWDGNEVRTVDLLHYFDEIHQSAGLNSTDNLYTVTAGVYRERSTGTLYVRYYGEVVGGAYSNYFISLTDSEELPAPFWGGYYEGEPGYETWRQQKEQEQQEYDTMLADRFETLVELTVGGFDGVGDYTGTIGEVRQRLEAE